MSQFEYVSVAVALVFSFAVARLLSGFQHTSARDRGSAIALIWNVGMVIAALAVWWIFWRFRDVDWTPLGFVWIVGTPAFIYLRASVLLTDNPSLVTSWDTHYMAIRRQFFGLGMAQALHSAMTPWVLGLYGWFAPAPVHAGAILNLAVCFVGLRSSSHRVHLALSTLLLIMSSLFLFFVPSSK